MLPFWVKNNVIQQLKNLILKTKIIYLILISKTFQSHWNEHWKASSFAKIENKEKFL